MCCTRDFVPSRRGLTMTEVIVVIAVVIVLATLLIVGLRGSGAHDQRGIGRLKDQVHVKQIHQAWILMANDYAGVFPTPGLLGRRPVDLGNGPVRIPGRGAEDHALNTTANVHSAVIMQSYYPPELTVSPTEPSPHVVVKEDYDWEAYDPVNGAWWDDTFRGDLQDVCNFSYASMPVAGPRRDAHWTTTTADPQFAMIGNRGPRDGVPVDDHITYRIHGSEKRWNGVVCFGDNHTESLDAFTPEGLDYTPPGGTPQPDNLFRNDTGTTGTAEGFDNWLVIVSGLAGPWDAPKLTLEFDSVPGDENGD